MSGEKLAQLRRSRHSRTENRWAQKHLAAEAATIEAWGADDAPVRPTRRSDCVDGERPCPWVSCRYHLALEVRRNGAIAIAAALPPFTTKATGSVGMYDEAIDWDALPETCALDVAERGEATLEEVGALLGGLTREAVRLIEEKAKRHVQRAVEGTDLEGAA